MSDDAESLFNLCAAPRLRAVRGGASGKKARPPATHFVPTRFEDKVKYMQAIERNRAAFLAQRRRQLELLELGLASAEVRNIEYDVLGGFFFLCLFFFFFFFFFFFLFFLIFFVFLLQLLFLCCWFLCCCY